MIEIERLCKVQENVADKSQLTTGEFYECVKSEDDLYTGWILYVVNISSQRGRIYGSWLNKGPAIFGDITDGSEDFRFKKLNMKLVEVKE